MTDAVAPLDAARLRMARRGALAKRLGGNTSLVLGLAIIVVVLLASLFASYLTPYDPIAHNLRNMLKPPSWEHWFGTDNFGRDIFTRVLHAAKLDLMIGFLCVVFPWILGSALGGIAGYFGGLADTIIMRVVDTFTAFPFLVMVIGIIAILGPGLVSMYIALTLAGWSMYARIVRAEVLVAKKSEYVLAAQALGYGHTRIMFRHILPNAMTASLTFLPFILAGSVTTLTSLDFLGFGLPVGSPSLGELLLQGKNNLNAPWLAFTGFFIIALMLSLLVFIGEAVRDAFNPRKVLA